MEARAATAGMVATLRLRQLQDDVCDSEQAELRRLEGGVTDSDDSETDSDDSEEGQLVPERVEEGADLNWSRTSAHLRGTRGTSHSGLDLPKTEVKITT